MNRFLFPFGLLGVSPASCWDIPIILEWLFFVPEVLVARQCGISVLGLAWVSNMGCGIEKKPLSHAQTISETKKIEGKFKKLLEILFVKL